MRSRRPRGNSPWSWGEQGELLRRVQHAYEDLGKPRRAFALAAFRQEPHRQLVNDIMSEARVVDDTDLNCDVCDRYVIESENGLFLRVSMVGPYAMFERACGNGTSELIAREKDCSSGLEKNVFRILLRYGLRMMSNAQLATHVEINLPNVKHPTIYNALFSPDEEISI